MDTYTVFRCVSEFIPSLDLYWVMSLVSHAWRNIARRVSTPMLMRNCINYIRENGDYDLLYALHDKKLQIDTTSSFIGKKTQSQNAILWALETFKYNHAVMSTARHFSEGPYEYSEFMQLASSKLADKSIYKSTDGKKTPQGRLVYESTLLDLIASFDFYVATENIDAIEWIIPRMDNLSPIHMYRFIIFYNGYVFRKMERLFRIILTLVKSIGPLALDVLHQHIAVRDVDIYKALVERCPGFDMSKCMFAMFELLKTQDVDTCRWAFANGGKLESPCADFMEDYLDLYDYEDEPMPREISYQDTLEIDEATDYMERAERDLILMADIDLLHCGFDDFDHWIDYGEFNKDLSRLIYKMKSNAQIQMLEHIMSIVGKVVMRDALNGAKEHYPKKYVKLDVRIKKMVELD